MDATAGRCEDQCFERVGEAVWSGKRCRFEGLEASREMLQLALARSVVSRRRRQRRRPHTNIQSRYLRCSPQSHPLAAGCEEITRYLRHGFLFAALAGYSCVRRSEWPLRSRRHWRVPFFVFMLRPPELDTTSR